MFCTLPCLSFPSLRLLTYPSSGIIAFMKIISLKDISDSSGESVIHEVPSQAPV